MEKQKAEKSKPSTNQTQNQSISKNHRSKKKNRKTAQINEAQISKRQNIVKLQTFANTRRVQKSNHSSHTVESHIETAPADFSYN